MQIKGKRVYVASSWRNLVYPGIVHILKQVGADVYDFRHPSPNVDGFSWTQVEPSYKGGTTDVATWRRMLNHPIAKRGFDFDLNALKQCELCILVLPAGRSACFEFGYATGQGKPGIVIALDDETPDLMFRGAYICGSMDEFMNCIEIPND